MSKVSIASIVVALGFCASGSALAAPAADGADWAKAQIGEDSGSFYLPRAGAREAVPYAGIECGIDAASRAALQAATAAR